jgi:uncharacterized protein (DUF302 family)/uncharacterized membrane protein YidH (DUF202 family)
MSTATQSGQKASLSDYLAAERTLFAWIRTGLALMGLGFVVARFGIFLQQFRFTQHSTSSTPEGLSPYFGCALIGLGILVNILAGWRHARLVQQLNRGETVNERGSMQVVTIAFFLALVGLAMAIYLLWVRSSVHPQEDSNKETSMSIEKGEGIVTIAGHQSVDETVGKLQGVLEAKGVKLFAVVDHSGEAAKVGMRMRPTKLLIFGSPKAGTPLMQASPSSAIDLPLKILVWEDADGKIWLSYNSPEYLQRRHGISQELVQNIAVVGTLAAKAGE